MLDDGARLLSPAYGSYRERWKRVEIASICRGRVKLKFNEPRDPEPFHVAEIPSRRGGRLDMRVPLITLARVSRSFAPRGACQWPVEHVLNVNYTCSLLIKSIITVFSDFQKEPSDKQTASSTYNTFPDDLYLDDQDALEGSGRGGSDNRDDLEASGSGLGPDDEDGDDDGMTSDISREMNFNQSINEPLFLSLSFFLWWKKD